MYTMKHYSATKKNKIMQFAATWMDLEITTLSKVNQIKTYEIIYMWNVKNYYADKPLYETRLT